MGPSERSGTSTQVGVEAAPGEPADGGAGSNGDDGSTPSAATGEALQSGESGADDSAMTDERTDADAAAGSNGAHEANGGRRGNGAAASQGSSDRTSARPTVFDDLADGAPESNGADPAVPVPVSEGATGLPEIVEAMPETRVRRARPSQSPAPVPLPEIVEAVPEAREPATSPVPQPQPAIAPGGEPPDALVPAPPSAGDWADVPDAPLVVNSPQASIGRPADLRQVGRRPRVRKVSRVLRHIDPWSTFKLAAIFSVVLYGVLLTAGVLLWNIALNTGTVDNVERWFTQFGWESFELNGGEIYHNAWILGLFGAIALTGFAVLSVTLFNLVSDIIGGVRMTVLEEEVVERTVSPARRFVVRRPVGHHQFPVHPEHRDVRTEPHVVDPAAAVTETSVEDPDGDR